MRKSFFVLILFLLLCILAYAAGVLLGALIPTGGQQEEKDTGLHIYLIDNGAHAELCLPASSAPEGLLSSIQDISPFSVGDPEYLCFGWGDDYFYPGTPTIEDLEFLPTLRALFLPTSAAVRISWYGGELLESENVRRFSISEEQAQYMYAFVLEYLKQDGDSLLLLDPERVSETYDASFFVEAEGSYTLFFTCNNWTNRALKRAGIRTGIWTPTTWGVGKD